MQASTRILVVDNDKAASGILISLLSSDGSLPITAESGENALHLASLEQPDLILLDPDLPDTDGADLLKELRQWFHNPIIIVSSRTEEAQKVTMLDLGANDYITKPFGTAELLARIRAALRNSPKKFLDNSHLHTGYHVNGLEIDFQNHLVKVNGVKIHLTRMEFKIVELLARHPGRVLTYEYIMEQIWGPYLSESNKILRVNMTNIRRKLEQNPSTPQYILTEAGIGYRMSQEDLQCPE